MTWEVRQGDCVELMAAMPAGSVDAVVCDPPYGLEFMGKEWDRLDSRAYLRTRQDGRTNPSDGKSTVTVPESYVGGLRAQEWHQAWATEALRVLKPGGHLLAFGGTRTYHRLACAVEDAGFEIRDTISWLYGSGFPKSLDVSKAIDKAAGAEREVVGSKITGNAKQPTNATGEFGSWSGDETGGQQLVDVTAPATPEADRWQGWGTALKPAHEPVVVARKPLSGTVAANVLEHGTGALNVDGCRMDSGGEEIAAHKGTANPRTAMGDGWHDAYKPGDAGQITHAAGRWPANVVLDEEAARLLDEQTGELVSTQNRTERLESASGMFGVSSGANYGDPGGASRFYFCAKSSRGERNAGLDGFEERHVHTMNDYVHSSEGRNVPKSGGPKRNVHPTVKPIELMRWLVRLVTPPGGTVLDPFAGSGSTGCAAVLEGFDFIGLEREPEYVAIAEARIGWWHKHRGDGKADAVLAAGEARDGVEATGQLDMFGEAS